MNAPSDLPFHPGDVLLGKYRIERILGAGGMGAVVEATHLGLDQRVAMKFMLPRVADRADNVQRFMREARAASKLRSEHIPRVFDFGSLENNIPYLVMELLEGEDLANRIERHSPLDPAEICEVGIQACEALSEAHRHGIVHRDIKPANLFVTYRTDGSPCTKVLDFGIAKEPLETGSLDPKGLTDTGAMMGSPPYMSPEQLDSARRVDARSDIWSMGIALYEALTGTRPFVSDNLGGLIMCILDTVPELPSAVRPDVPVPLAQVILKCIQRRPEDRYQNTFELAAALAPFAPARCRVLLDRIAANCQVATPTKRGNALLESLDQTVEAPSTTPTARERMPEAAIKSASSISQTNDATVRTNPPQAPEVRTLPSGDKAATTGRWLGVLIAAAAASIVTAIISNRNAPSTAASPPAASPAPFVSAVIPAANDAPKVAPNDSATVAPMPSAAASAASSATTSIPSATKTSQPSRNAVKTSGSNALPDYGGRK